MCGFCSWTLLQALNEISDFHQYDILVTCLSQLIVPLKISGDVNLRRQILSKITCALVYRNYSLLLVSNQK